MPPMPTVTALTHHCDGQLHPRRLDVVIAGLADRQHGVVARAQLIDVGVGEGAIELRLARGRLHPVHRGVYAVGHRVLSAEGRWMAAVLAGGSGAVLSHQPAGALWGIRPARGWEVEVTCARKLRSRRGLKFHWRSLLTDEVTTHDRIPVTTVPRTLFDLADVIPRHQFERTVNEAEIRHLWDPLSLADLLRRHPRRPGAAAIRAVLATPGANITRSELEDRFLGLLDAVRLPRPETNVPIEVNGFRIEADCVWGEPRLIVELDGHATHSTRAAYEHDRARDRRLVAAGWRVMRVTWRQLHDQPEALAHDLRASLAARPVANLRRA
jgi:hypothetical protein